jgi:preprotein translocase subunit YajC
MMVVTDGKVLRHEFYEGQEVITGGGLLVDINANEKYIYIDCGAGSSIMIEAGGITAAGPLIKLN